MEYLPRGNLREENNRAKFALTECAILLRQALEGLAHLHAERYAHRDLKPENILIQSRVPLNIKLADFGLSNQADQMVTFCGSIAYIAPEVLKNQCQKIPYTSAVDIWSLGVVILRLGYFDINKPHEDVSPESLGQAHGIDALRDLLTSRMIVQDPKGRSSAAQCLNEAHAIPMDSLETHANRDVPRLDQPRGRHHAIGADLLLPTTHSRRRRGIFERGHRSHSRGLRNHKDKSLALENLSDYKYPKRKQLTSRSDNHIHRNTNDTTKRKIRTSAVLHEMPDLR